MFQVPKTAFYKIIKKFFILLQVSQHYFSEGSRQNMADRI